MTEVCLVFGSKDPASVKMYETLTRVLGMTPDDLGGFGASVEVIDRDLLYVEENDLPASDSYLFFSRHSGKIPCITLHATGNPTNSADMGGQPLTLARADPNLAGSVLNCLIEAHPTLPVVIEATHHGPTLRRSSVLFVEIGTGEVQWSNADILQCVVSASVKGVSKRHKFNGRAATFYGGPHYAEKFTRHAYSRNLGIGHVLSKYAAHEDNMAVLADAPFSSEPHATLVVVDKKGLPSSYREELVSEVRRRGCEVTLI
ncbi:MAG: D-aminoacyl-tRNA deacylase [Thermoprotei archaeon]